MRTLLADARFALRMLRRRPGFTAVAILTLALGIGANTAVFSVIRGVLLRPLPYADPSRLVAIWESNLQANARREPSSPPNFKDWAERNHSFSAMAAYTLGWAPLTESGDAEMLDVGYVTANYFDVLGVKPALGRAISPGDEDAGVVLLSDEFWDRHFKRDPTILGRKLRLTGVPATVIGVMPPHFHDADFVFRSAAEAWMPLNPARFGPARRSDFLRVIGRTRPGMRIGLARAEMAAISSRLGDEYPSDNAQWTVEVHPLSEAVAGDTSRPLWLLFASAWALLGIACANVANLSLARSSERRREFAIRAALGSGAAPLFRQLMTESLMLGLLGGAAGFLLGNWTMHAMLALGGSYFPRAQEVSIDGWVITFAIAASSVTAVLFGLLPARRATRADLNDALKSASRASTAGRGYARNALVVAEVGLSVILVAAAGLLLRSFWQAESVDLGFEPASLLTAGVRMFSDPAKIPDFLDEFLRRVERMPGVTSAAACAGAPMTPAGHNAFLIEGQPRTGLPNDAILDPVTPAYFRTMSIALRSGRVLNADASPQAVISETLARRNFPIENPLGRRISFDEGKTFLPVVGVVADVHQLGVTEAPKAQVYVPFRQHPFTRVTLAVRTSADPNSLIPAIRAELHSMDPTLPVYDIRTGEALIASSVGPRRFALTLVELFAGLALLIAAVGIYGVISLSVSESTRELGIRMALGALKSDVLKTVLGRGLKLVLTGIAAGALVALAANRVMGSYLYNVSAYDPVTFAAVAGIFILVALAACLIPARRATQVDPMIALRYE
jgi:putative ABC transport system permease protein